MGGQLETKAQEFSVSGIDEAALVEALQPLGLVSHRVMAREPALVMLVELNGCDPEPEKALVEVRAHLKGVGRAEPATRDEYGSEVLPTGTIQIRFHEVPSDIDLTAFGKDAGLRVLKRNEFQPAQVAFEPADEDHADLSEAIDNAKQRPEVRKAWAEVLSRYRRH